MVLTVVKDMAAGVEWAPTVTGYSGAMVCVLSAVTLGVLIFFFSF